MRGASVPRFFCEVIDACRCCAREFRPLRKAVSGRFVSCRRAPCKEARPRGFGRHERIKGRPSDALWREVVCIASGPSLTADDCEKVKAWRSQEEGRGVIVTNTTFRLAPWADVLYAMDRAWWRVHHEEVHAKFPGRKIGHHVHCFGAERVRFKHGGNSGAGALCLAAHFGAKRIIMLGYDCKHAADGKRHWHGDHPKGLGNAGSVGKWPAQFRDVAHRLHGVEIVNATRDTALTIWPKVPLEEALA